MSYQQSGERVTNGAILSEVRGLAAEVRRGRGTSERRLAFLEEKFELEASALRAQCQKNERDLAVLSERVATRTGIFGAVQAIGLTAATILGVKF